MSQSEQIKRCWNHMTNTLKQAATSMIVSILIACAFPILGYAAAAKDAGTDTPAGQRTWGTYNYPFAPDSPWNSRPVNPRLGTQAISPSKFAPLFGEGAFSTGIFLSKESDGPVTVTGAPGSQGLYEADSETFHDVTLPHWPSDVVSASGTDGHADIVDPTTGILHSFYQLRQQNGQWTATLYAWTRLDGRGWGNPAHYYQGSRAVAVPASAGLIRKHEVLDGDVTYRHALAISLPFNSLSAATPYIFPATSADGNAAATNTGTLSEGALLMLPYGFDMRQITNPALRKVAQTLKTYGAYVVDKNDGVPFIIYVENGTGLGSLNNSVAAEMEKIRLAMRQVVAAPNWLDGNNRVFTPDTNLNLLSMRGDWQVLTGTATGTFDTYAQALIVPPATSETQFANFSTRVLQHITWATPAAGTEYALTANTTAGATLRLQLYDPQTGMELYSSPELHDGETATFQWPSANAKANLYAKTVAGGATASVKGLLVRTVR